MRPSLTRRAVLAGAGGLLLTACTGRRTPAARPTPDPDVALRAAAVARERALLAAYDAHLAATPALAARLAPLRADHLAHLQALGAGPVPGPAPAPLPVLADLERRTAEGHAQDCVTASRRLAPVLASLSACEASHLVVL